MLEAETRKGGSDEEVLAWAFAHGHQPNPQETLLARLNGCMTVGDTTLGALEGIALDELRIEAEGHTYPAVSSESRRPRRRATIHVSYTVHLQGNGPPEPFANVHRTVMATSPNYFNLRNPIPLEVAAGHRRRHGGGCEEKTRRVNFPHHETP